MSSVTSPFRVCNAPARAGGGVARRPGRGKGAARGSSHYYSPTSWTSTTPLPAPAIGACPRSGTSGFRSRTGSGRGAARTAATAIRCAPRAPSPPCTSSGPRRRARTCGHARADPAPATARRKLAGASLLAGADAAEPADRGFRLRNARHRLVHRSPRPVDSLPGGSRVGPRGGFPGPRGPAARRRRGTRAGRNRHDPRVLPRHAGEAPGRRAGRGHPQSSTTRGTAISTPRAAPAVSTLGALGPRRPPGDPRTGRVARLRAHGLLHDACTGKPRRSAGRGLAVRPRSRLLRQRRLGGHGHGAQARPPVLRRHRRTAARQLRRPAAELPWEHARRPGRRRQRRAQGALRAAPRRRGPYLALLRLSRTEPGRIGGVPMASGSRTSSSRRSWRSGRGP